MAVQHPPALRDVICDLVVDRIDAGAAAGSLEFQTGAGAEIATLTFSDPAFGPASAGTAIADAIAGDVSEAGGTIAKAVVKDSNGVEVFSCSVTATGGGGDIQLNMVAVAAGQNVALTSLSYTASV